MRSIGGAPSRAASFLASAVNEPVVISKLCRLGRPSRRGSRDPGAYASAVALALEEDREADQPEPVNAESVDSAVAALPGDGDAVEVGLAE